jgi:hypothetical protein
MAIANELRGHVHQGHALSGILYVHLRSLRDGLPAAKEAAPRREANVHTSQAEKGVASPPGASAAPRSLPRSGSAFWPPKHPCLMASSTAGCVISR